MFVKHNVSSVRELHVIYVEYAYNVASMRKEKETDNREKGPCVVMVKKGAMQRELE